MQMVLYGVWPMLALGAALSWLFLKYKNQALAKFRGRMDLGSLPLNKLRRVHKFSRPGALLLMQKIWCL